MEWIKLKDRRPPNNNGIPKSYGVENKDGVRDIARWVCGGMDLSLQFTEPENKRFKASEIVRWCELDFIK